NTCHEFLPGDEVNILCMIASVLQGANSPLGLLEGIDYTHQPMEGVGRYWASALKVCALCHMHPPFYLLERFRSVVLKAGAAAVTPVRSRIWPVPARVAT